MAIGIKAIKSFIPEESIDNKLLIEKFNKDQAFLEDKLGIITRPVSSQSHAASDLAVEAAKKILDSGLKKQDVDLLIVCTQNPDFKLPNTASIVQDLLSLPNSVASFDLNQGCSGFIYSLAVAKSMMLVLNYKNALVITSDPYSKIIDEDDNNTALLFGDAASAVWLTDQCDNEIMNFSFGTDGSQHEKLIVKYGGSRNPFKQKKEIERTSDSYDPYFRMDGRAVFNFMMTRVPADINNCLRNNELEINDVDYFIFHQASKYMILNLKRIMKIPDDRIILFLENVGNTVSSSIPLAFENLMFRKKLHKNIIMLSGFGVGLSWGSVVIKY